MSISERGAVFSHLITRDSMDLLMAAKLYVIPITMSPSTLDYIIDLHL
jgi:hypothetical protein